MPAAESAWEAILSTVPNPRHTVAGQEPGWVSDAAGSMQAGTVDQINDLIEALDVDLNVEVAVVSLPPDALPEGTDPAEFGVNLFNYWGIGHVDTNNGMLVRYAVWSLPLCCLLCGLSRGLGCTRYCGSAILALWWW